nr:somuncurin 4 [Pleurodema somuncurensis]
MAFLKKSLFLVLFLGLVSLSMCEEEKKDEKEEREVEKRTIYPLRSAEKRYYQVSEERRRDLASLARLYALARKRNNEENELRRRVSFNRAVIHSLLGKRSSEESEDKRRGIVSYHPRSSDKRSSKGK